MAGASSRVSASLQILDWHDFNFGDQMDTAISIEPSTSVASLAVFAAKILENHLVDLDCYSCSDDENLYC